MSGESVVKEMFVDVIKYLDGYSVEFFICGTIDSAGTDVDSILFSQSYVVNELKAVH